jgi:hypothetical protein
MPHFVKKNQNKVTGQIRLMGVSSVCGVNRTQNDPEMVKENPIFCCHYIRLIWLSFLTVHVQEGASYMSIEGRIRELDHRHTDLKSLIARETKSPSVDDLYLKSLKLKKLKVKEELEKIKMAFEKERTPMCAVETLQ